MKKGKLILIGGGARSGKSSFALKLAKALGARRAYIATAEALDAEMAERIARHREERKTDFDTVEAPLDPAGTLRGMTAVDVAVLDCLTFWISNLLLRDASEEQVTGEVQRLAEALQHAAFHCIVVTNEVGMGVVPDSPLGRRFRDASGRTHQTLSAIADEIYLGALGSMIRLKPTPLISVGNTEEIQ